MIDFIESDPRYFEYVHYIAKANDLTVDIGKHKESDPYTFAISKRTEHPGNIISYLTVFGGLNKDLQYCKDQCIEYIGLQQG